VKSKKPPLIPVHNQPVIDSVLKQAILDSSNLIGFAMPRGFRVDLRLEDVSRIEGHVMLEQREVDGFAETIWEADAHLVAHGGDRFDELLVVNWQQNISRHYIPYLP
jgi:hypothetical protein